MKYEIARRMKDAGEKQAVIAATLGVSEERVRQILKAGPASPERSRLAVENAKKLLEFHGYRVTK